MVYQARSDRDRRVRMHAQLFSHVLWPWDSPGKNTGVGNPKNQTGCTEEEEPIEFTDVLYAKDDEKRRIIDNS